ncbi:MAG TPA: hypothetical protein VKT32_10380 [Chthonomonadaceae bacterium]|nr:hypothetical protein [Chthonomonadaceae bacterium]
MSDTSAEQSQPASEPEPEWAAEDRRLRELRKKRREQGVCLMCGKPLGFFDRFAKREQHKGCETFKE